MRNPRGDRWGRPRIVRSAGTPNLRAFLDDDDDPGTGLTERLNEAVRTSAAALENLYDGPVTIRFSPDRRSGGAWLTTPTRDRVGLSVDLDEHDDLQYGVTVSPFLTTGDREGEVTFPAPSFSEALQDLHERAPGTFDEVCARLEVARQAWTERYGRYALVSRDGSKVLLAPYAPQGYDALARRARRPREGETFLDPLPWACLIRDGRLMFLDGEAHDCRWREAGEAPLWEWTSLG